MLPILPMIMAVAAIGSGVVSGISSVKNAKEQAKAVQHHAQVQINERARQARKLMSSQESSFLKSGVFFSGTPLDIINETYSTYLQDKGDMVSDANTKVRNLARQGKTSFYTNIGKGIVNAGLSFVGAGGMSALGGAGTKVAQATTSPTFDSITSTLNNFYLRDTAPITLNNFGKPQSIGINNIAL